MEFVEYSGCIHVAGGLNRQVLGIRGQKWIYPSRQVRMVPF